MLSRRSFMRRTLMTGFAWGNLPFASEGESASEKPATDPNLCILLSDTHIQVPDEKTLRAPLAAAVGNLRRCVREILARHARPAQIIFLGDNTDFGLPEQGERFRSLIRPLAEAGIPCRLLAGNHDYYANRLEETYAPELAISPVPKKMVGTVRFAEADILCLDSTDPTLQDGYWGRFEGPQLAWIKKQVQEHKAANRPYFICCHHPFDMIPIPKGMNMFASASGWICGHIHDFRQKVSGWGLRDQSIPSTATPPAPGIPLGYVEMRIHPERLDFRQITLDAAGTGNNKHFSLAILSPNRPWAKPAGPNA